MATASSRKIFRFVLLAGVTIFLLGLALGIYVQHRYPLGNLRRAWEMRPTPSTRLSLAELKALPKGERLIILTIGQSNAANFGALRADGGPGVYAWADNKLYVGRDPFPGANGYGGSVWSRLGARLQATTTYPAIVFACGAVGGTSVFEWSHGNYLENHLRTLLDRLASQGLTPDFILWQQGEEDALAGNVTGTQYEAALRQVVEICAQGAPATPVIIAQATRTIGLEPNAQIRLAQARVAAGTPNGVAGPDFDQLDGPMRSDGVHFSAAGLDAAAELWWQCLRPMLPDARRTSETQP